MQICSPVCWLGVMFGIGFVCLLVSGYLLTLGMVSRDGPEKGLGRSKTHPNWMATEEAAAVETVQWW